MKLNQPPKNCGNCNNMIEGRYEYPVCYQLRQLNGEPAAAKVRRNGKACQSWREKVAG